MSMISSRWQRVLVVAVLVLPLLVIILLSFPVWFFLPFREAGRKFILELVCEFTKWIKTANENGEDADGPTAATLTDQVDSSNDKNNLPK